MTALDSRILVTLGQIKNAGHICAEYFAKNYGAGYFTRAEAWTDLQDEVGIKRSDALRFGIV